MTATRRYDVVGLGEPMVEFNQTHGADNRTYLQGFGGDTMNAVIAAARQGARVAYLTRLGDDAFGRWLRELWVQEGVDGAAVVLDGAAPTGIYFVSHDAEGHTFSYLRAGSAASRMGPQDVRTDVIAQARWLHLSGISQAISASATDAAFHAMRAAREAGTRVAYDANLRLRLWPLDRARAVIVASIPMCDLFLPGMDDLRLLGGMESPEAALDWCHRSGAATVVLKAGSQGAWVSDNTGRTRLAPHPVEVVDATGAGDCFDGALLARLAAGDDLRTAARYANAAAALTTMGFGAVAPLPRPEAVRAMLAKT